MDNTNPQNFSRNQGKTLQDEASATKLAYSYGFLAGYKVPLSVTGVYVALEGDTMRHGGVATGRLTGSGTSQGANQLGEVWPEDWTLEKDRSYGLTARLGAGIPFFGTWFGPSVYGLLGVRRLGARFDSTYTGCTTAAACTEPEQFLSGSESFTEGFNGWTVGGGIEKRAGSLAIRAEARVTDYASSERVVDFSDLYFSVPVDLEPDSISIGVSLVWHF